MMDITRKDVAVQLQRILISEAFRESHKLQSFLRYIVSENAEGRSDQLKQYNIAIGAFNRDSEFDPNTDPIVRIQAGRLRSSLSSYYYKEGKNDPVLIEVPIGSYIPKISYKPTVPDNNYQVEHDSTIGITPFIDLSEDSSKQYIADGFTEELLLEMARYDHLTIIRLTNDSNVEGENNQLTSSRNARFILQGSLRFADSRIKLVVCVEDNTSGEQVWSKEYIVHLDSTELINSQENIAQNVANAVGDIMGGVVFKRIVKESMIRKSKNFVPYDAVLRHHHYEKYPTDDRYIKALEVTEKALKIDPEFGMGWAIISNLTITNIALSHSDDAENALEDAVSMAEKGVELEPNVQLTRSYLAFAYLMNNRLNETLEQSMIALDLNPNAAFYVGGIGWMYALAGKWKKGIELIEKGIYLNPDYPKWYHMAPFFFYLKTSDYNSALKEAKKLNISDLFWDPLVKTIAYQLTDQSEKAQESLKNLLELMPDFTEHSEYLIGMYVKFDSIKQKMMLALKTAGLGNPVVNE